MNEVKWVKIMTDIFDNRKIKHLRRLPNGDLIVLIWIMLLTLAGRCNADGRLFLTESIPYNAKMLADELGFEENVVSFALTVFEQLDMIALEDEFLRIAGWEEYQNVDGMEKIKEQNRLRKQRQRERQKLLRAVSQDGHGTVTEDHATEEDTEQEEETEKEIHSFCHSAKNEEDTYIEAKIAEAGFEGKDAEIYREELRENLRLQYLGGTLGQNLVLMSGEQFDDLCQRLSLDELEKYFAIVAECERNGKRYKKKSHYQAILDMARKDRRIEL